MKNLTFWLRRFVTVYGVIMLCTFFMCLFFNPGSQLPVVEFFGRILVFTLLGLLSLAVYYSKDELSARAWWVRTALHAVILEAIFLPLAHIWGFWHGGTDVFVYAGFILLGKIIWQLIEYGIDAGTAARINEKIREYRRSQTGGRSDRRKMYENEPYNS